MHNDTVIYQKETAPKAIKVDMDYMADPIWTSDTRNLDDSLVFINSDLDAFPLPPALKHMLYCYQQAWETAHSTEFIQLEALCDEYQTNPKMSEAIENSLDVLLSACEDMLEDWLKENHWHTTLVR